MRFPVLGRAIRVASVGQTVPGINIRNDTGNLFFRKTRFGIAAQAFSFHFGLFESGSVQGPRKFHDKRMAIAGRKRIVGLKLIHVITQRSVGRRDG